MDTPTNIEEVRKTEGKLGKKQLSFERLRLALEKLQLARAKTTITFIALGFTCYKFFYARIEDHKKPLAEFPNGRHIGMFLIFVGFVILLLSTIQHHKSLAKLKAQYGEMAFSVSLILSYFILLLSVSLLYVVILHL
ncbi:MAG TPA: DUF202 domain-containing protein [Chryseolinea sp.]|nr:DUF202 domain-containing protein [Chryseolinea sp.]